MNTRLLRILYLLVIALASSQALAQSSRYINSAHNFVVDAMQRDWRTSVTIEEWISSEVQYFTDDVLVRGKGRVTRRNDDRMGFFSYEVRIYERKRMAPSVRYDVTRWEDNGRYDERYFRQRTESLVREKLERDLGYSIFVDFKHTDFYNARGDLQGVRGDGEFWRRASDRRGTFTFDLKFDRRHGDAEVVVVSLKSRPTSGWAPDSPEDRRFIRSAREAVEEKFSRRTTIDWRGDEEIGDVMFGVRTVTGSFVARGGDRPGRYTYRARLGAGTGNVQSVSVSKQ